jgi:hypothetical protein
MHRSFGTGNSIENFIYLLIKIRPHKLLIQHPDIHITSIVLAKIPSTTRYHLELGTCLLKRVELEYLMQQFVLKIGLNALNEH